MCTFVLGVLAHSAWPSGINCTLPPVCSLQGASAGGYALAGAQVSTLVLTTLHKGEKDNGLGKMLVRVVQLLSPIFILVCFANDIYGIYYNPIPSSTSVASHLGGAVAGFLMGLTELFHCDWKRRICFRLFWFVVALAGVTLNVLCDFT